MIAAAVKSPERAPQNTSYARSPASSTAATRNDRRPSSCAGKEALDKELFEGTQTVRDWGENQTSQQ